MLSIDQAISEWGKNKHESVDYTVLLHSDQSINYSFLKPYLKIIPNNKVYMSKHTFKLYEENEKERMLLLDAAQDAVFLYLIKMDTSTIPVYHGTKRLNQQTLVNAKVIPEPFPVELFVEDTVFITDSEQAV
ncbi:DUF3939 domain-containing protein [Bacillus spongiae]|uniref:DUF3939 domain-containing protein n=1 Tax=Bacillus spongiae TaxID=2683610 RepID=A0ABU8HGN6_9BACI